MNEAKASRAVKPSLNGATASHKPKRSASSKPKAESLAITEADKQLIKLANKGLTQREMSELTGIPKSTIQYKLQSLKDDPEFTNFKKNKADVLEELQFKLASVVDHDLLKSMVSKRGMTDLAILEDKIRLMRGEATSITTIDIRALGVMVNLTTQNVTDSSVIDVESSSSEDPG